MLGPWQARGGGYIYIYIYWKRLRRVTAAPRLRRPVAHSANWGVSFEIDLKIKQVGLQNPSKLGWFFDRFWLIFGRFWGWKSMKNQQKSIPKRIKNKISIWDRFWTALEWVLGGLGGVLGGSWAALGSNMGDPGPIWVPSWGPKSIKIGPKSDLKCYHIYHRFEDRFLERFGANLAPSWRPTPSQNESKLALKST